EPADQLQACHAQGVRRGADGQPRLRPRFRHGPADRRGCEGRRGSWCRGLPRHRRRQHLPRHRRRRGGHGSRPGRLHGHAGDGDECARHAVGPREVRPADAGAERHPDAVALRALYPQACHPPHGEGPRRHLRRRHGQSLLHHGHRRRAARRRDGVRRALQGHAGGWRLFRRPAEEPEGGALRDAHLSRHARAGPAGDGCRGHQPVPREQAADHRLQYPRARRLHGRDAGRGEVHHGGRAAL
ncbi:MAG: Uridine monophosphate kinase, partial [uncultured Craurococcus sp.]